LNIVQIVKKFGPVGGMEEYAYRLTQELFKLGLRITVLCEKNYSPDYRGINVIELGVHSKPHWLSHYRFSQKVNLWLSENHCDERMVHSHERQSLHHVTTFHTTPFNLGKTRIARFLSLRNFFYEKLEGRELFGSNTRAIVPVSNLLGDLIRVKYPEASEVITGAIHPGVDLRLSAVRSKGSIPDDGGTIGFIGKEWKRKGLPKAIRIWRELKKTRPNLKLKIAGVSPEVLSHLIEKSDTNVEILGFIKNKKSFYESIDLLLHPAKLEAFGMVISEALCMHAPVICSSECGASEVLSKSSSFHIPESQSDASWVQSADEILRISKLKFLSPKRWDDVAKEYKQLYEEIQ
jgi:UDP-glucose:(heptosyl)LPS alpha-1,3-glucosyltransferase